MKENHAPPRESRLKKNHKVVKRGLNASLNEEVSTESATELTEISPTFDASDISTFTPPISSESSSDPNISTNSDDQLNVPVERCIFHKLDGSLEVDIASSFLEKAINQVINSTDVDQQSKKLIDVLLKVILDDYCYALPGERDFCSELVLTRGRLLFMCLLLWSFILCVVFFFGSISGHSHYGPLPT